MTPEGQVALLPGSRSIFSLIQEDAEASIRQLEHSRLQNPNHFQQVREQALRLSGYQKPEGQQSPLFVGRYYMGGYNVEKFILEAEGSYPLPFLVWIPNKPGPHPLLVYLDPKGKPTDPSIVEPIVTWVENGFAVLTPDLPGIGELGPGTFKGDAFIDGVSFNMWFASILIGRSITAIQAADLNRIVQALKQRRDIDTNRVTGIALHSQSATLLHSAIALPTFHRLILGMPLASNSALITQERYDAKHIPGMVAGSLFYYDIPDLLGSLAPLDITIIHPTTPSGEILSHAEMADVWRVALRRYDALNAPENLSVITQDDLLDFEALLLSEILK